MSLSNTATPKYYGQFRDAVIRGEIPVCEEISLEMNRIDALIANPSFYYDDNAVEGWIKFCEREMTLTDGSDLHLLDSFKLWGEEVFGWYYFETKSVWEPNPDGHGGHYVRKDVKKRLTKKAIPDSRTRGRQVFIRLDYSRILSYCRYIDNTPDNDISYNETVRGDHVSDQDCYYQGKRSVVSILNRRIASKHNRIKS